VVILALLWYSIGSAHTVEVVKSEPPAGAVLSESPKEVRVWFNEELQTKESSLKVFTPEGKQVDNGDGGVDLNDPDHASMVVSLPPLGEGAYTVRWHAVLTDGDATDGEFAFYVGSAGAAAATAASAGDLSAPEAETSDEENTPATSPLSSLWLIGGGAGVVIVVAGYLLLARKPRSSGS
jgi:methionine-rich copper-binding protein CopC